jgi:Zn-dependent membrane protease YugP
MTQTGEKPDAPFRPLRPASRPRLIAAFVLGPVLWVVALAVVAVLVKRTDAIELGLAVTAAAFVLALIVLPVLWSARRREERDYAARR